MLRDEDHNCPQSRKTWKKAEVRHPNKLNQNPSTGKKAEHFT